MIKTRARTVQELIDALSGVEDKSRTVVLAGGGLSGVEVLRTSSGHLIVWDAEKYDAGGKAAMDRALMEEWKALQ